MASQVISFPGDLCVVEFQSYVRGYVHGELDASCWIRPDDEERAG